jgi:hypothetical protein
MASAIDSRHLIFHYATADITMIDIIAAATDSSADISH